MEPNKDPLADKPVDETDALSHGGSLEYTGDSSVSESADSSSSEASESSVSKDPSESSSTASTEVKDATDPTKPAKKVRKNGPLQRFWHHFNIYIVLFGLLVIVSVVIVTLIYLKSRTTTVTPAGSIRSQSLSADTLKDLANNGTQIGDPKQVLNIQSNSVFSGAVLVRGELQVAGGLKLGSSSLSINDLTIGGSANINTLQAQSLNVAGASRSNDLTVLRNLTVNGASTINGGLTTPVLSVGRLQLNSDLSLTRHIVGGGATPARSNGTALGSGGTTTVSGSDTAGSITINTGGGPAAGCFVSLTFTSSFSGTPHVVVTPVGSAAASLNYYINRSNTGFSVCTTNAAPNNASFGFDYHIFN